MADESPEALPERWAPDEQLVPAVLAGSSTVTMASLSPPDRGWVVAGLTLAGLSGEVMAERLDCTVRRIRQVAVEAPAILATLYMTQADNFDMERRMSSGEVARLARALGDAERDRDRYHGQLVRALDAALTGEAGPTFAKCGHTKARYNVYEAPKTGKLTCRQCHADAQAEYRERVKARTASAYPEAHEDQGITRQDEPVSAQGGARAPAR